MRIDDFLMLRQKWTAFHYDALETVETPYEWRFIYRYRMTGPSGEERFTHQVTLKRNLPAAANLSDTLVQHAALQLGLVETINYWKLACPMQLIVHPFRLLPEQLRFWEKLFVKGLGEFFYVNQIYGQVPETDLIRISSNCEAKEYLPLDADVTGVLIPVGGGKDSIVTMELLRPLHDESHVFLLSARQASVTTAEAAGFPKDSHVTMTRKFDKRMLEMNHQGFLNGHVPYSAILAFSSILAAVLYGKESIVLSNEGSANEPTVPDTHINHQYSKSMEFEEDFSTYIRQFVTPDIAYFSLLRPWSEARIAQAFAGMTQYHRLFLSCNQGSKENRWCCQCPKCLFVYIMLAAFAGISYTASVFGEDLLEKESLRDTLDELLGIAPNKPFECVGTVAETTWCMRKLSQTAENPPVLVRYFRDVESLLDELPMRMTEPEMAYLIPEKFKSYLQLDAQEG